ncbi:iron complex transport system permease protein [Sediminihabitans luteus]|uniref:Iron complex transport system permease protein n=1 Tax=Sediminihabitans luteus TaxID=1138585 RepID=A0A2M9D0Q3_9CELL|nr:iron ABC transporter permease [Sediminihabitans luteus]PJJ77717.1 iron complex transport system permease protein [Sediminihabitans luteus]GIJ00056.1 ABC transporter permease [Sediminihabitans luteus]
MTSPTTDAAPRTDPAAPAPTPTKPAHGARRTTLVVGGLSVALVVLTVVAGMSGQVPVAPVEVLGSLAHHLGLDVGPLPAHPQGENALWIVRFPRVVLALTVGASLACAGALMQGVFGNPLAEPGVIGVSSGAAVGASTAIVLGGSLVAGPWIAAAAFAGGLVTTALVYAFARSNGRTEVVTLVLTGIAVNAFAGGLLAFLVFVADAAAREQIVFWQLGSLSGATWDAVAVALPIALGGIVVAMLVRTRLDLLALGERAARHLGVDVERLRLVVVAVVALLVSAGVAFTGIIAFVGLVVPHLVRMVLGPSHRTLIPVSALAGAVLLLAADLFARTAVDNVDLPLGMITSLIGGPFFFWLLRRTRARQGGWA